MINFIYKNISDRVQQSQPALGYSRKKKQEGWGHTFFWKTPGIFLSFLTLPLEISEKTKLHPWKFHKIMLDQSLGGFETKNQDPMEISHYFFLVTFGNSISFLINPWKLQILFLWYPWKFHILNLPFVFFLE